MRTIRLREQEATTCHLTTTELSLLLSAERTQRRPILNVGMRAGEVDAYDVRAGNVVGTLVWPGLQILIRPKVELENVFFLLGFRGGLAQWGEDQFPYEQERDFLRALAWAFDAEVRRALRYGIARSYLDLEDTLTTLRGRIDMGRQLRTRQDRAFPIECQYQEYSEDIILNRVIKAALRRLRAVSGLEPDLIRRLSQTGLAFAEVSDHEYSPAALPEVSFTRLNRQWEAASRLSLLILRQETLKDETGKAIGTSFTVDMNVLFEKFIEEVVRQATNRAGLRLQPQERVNLTQQIEMRPDLVVHSGDRAVAVGDAKYIQLEPAGWPHAGLYQLLAYCVALGLPRGLLIYASSRPLEVHRVIGAGVELEIVGIDMSRPAKQLVEQAHVAARRLVGHARAVRLPAALPQP